MTRPVSAITGELGELLTRAALVSQGWIVCSPEGHSTPFDIVAVKGDVFRRIQVKSTARAYVSKKTGEPITFSVYVSRLKRINGVMKAIPYQSGVDTFACVCTRTGTVAFVPAHTIPPDRYELIIGMRHAPEGGKRQQCMVLADDWTKLT